MRVNHKDLASKVWLFQGGNDIVTTTPDLSTEFAKIPNIDFNALEENKSEEFKPLLIYWAVFGVIKCIEWIPDATLGIFFWYWIAKSCLWLWCVGYERKFPGANCIYREGLMPLYTKNYEYVKDIEATWDNVVSKLFLFSKEKIKIK
ncbi:unnamed protein product [Gordionus sp. m RMFG-2023]